VTARKGRGSCTLDPRQTPQGHQWSPTANMRRIQQLATSSTSLKKYQTRCSAQQS
jgi:hypothetical protein